MESKKGKKNIEKEIRFVATRGRVWEVGELGEDSQKIQTSIYKVSKYKDVMYTWWV